MSEFSALIPRFTLLESELSTYPPPLRLAQVTRIHPEATRSNFYRFDCLICGRTESGRDTSILKQFSFLLSTDVARQCYDMDMVILGIVNETRYWWPIGTAGELVKEIDVRLFDKVKKDDNVFVWSRLAGNREGMKWVVIDERGMKPVYCDVDTGKVVRY
ncbi:hypothetical protein BJ508DRAFT_419174 [Ascobolus immersus RN42]|uniref:Uncharacterized protein n=1 Tax=Ascobolus immersus RN42 TaxID=1160509 RepID=A0A3N4HKP0_ASCIM|nr:hypothetical protein BJ508DRAFT_419174 [Ascobolus immersus RN42]